MLKVLRPTGNKQTGDPASHGYNAWDHDDKDTKGVVNENYTASFFGKVVQAKNSETRNWTANKPGDPYKPASGTRKLRTEDYGNYVKIKGEIDGKVYYQLGAHFKPGSVLPVGTEVKKGQTIAQIGNTGNSTGSHVHTEYRDESDKKILVEFIKEDTPVPQPADNMVTKEQIIIDAYKAITGEYPSDDEKKARLQKGENTLQLIEDLLKSDSRSKPYWLIVWGVKEHKDEVGFNYEQTMDEVRDILRVRGIVPGDDTEKVKAEISKLVDFWQGHREDILPKPKIIIGDKELTYINLWGTIIGVFKRG